MSQSINIDSQELLDITDSINGKIENVRDYTTKIELLKEELKSMSSTSEDAQYHMLDIHYQFLKEVIGCFEIYNNLLISVSDEFNTTDSDISKMFRDNL